MKKIVLFENLSVINEMHEKLYTVLPSLQDLYSEFQKAEYYNQSATLQQIVFNLGGLQESYKRELVRNEMKVSSSKLKIDENQALKMFELNETGALNEAHGRANLALTTAGIELDFFTIKAGEVIINPVPLQFFIDRNSVTAETPAELELHKMLTDFINKGIKLNDFLKKHDIPPIFLNNGLALLKGYFTYDRATDEYTINHRNWPMLKKRIRRAQALNEVE